MLPQNIAPWDIEYFKLKEFEKTAQQDFSPLRRCPPFSSETLAQEPHVRGALPTP